MDLIEYKNVQAIAKSTLAELSDYIHPDSTEDSISKSAIQLLNKKGVHSTWYHNVPAFVLLGSRSCISISGKDYQASNEKVGDFNLITVDLSPLMGDYWGDCARSFCIENGEVTSQPKDQEFKDGLAMEQKLHQSMLAFVTPDTLFSELFTFGNALINSEGWENLDFISNLGHSIEVKRSSRRYIDNNCHERLGDVNLFTFEPHIRQKGGKWGFKHENIYYFDDLRNVQDL